MDIFPPEKTSWSDSIWFILTISVFIILVSGGAYNLIQQQKQFLLDEKCKEISTIADLKTSQLVQWRKERFAEGAAIRANGMISHRINNYFTGSDNLRVRQEIRLWLANLIDLGEYSKGVLYTPEGVVIASNSMPKTQPSRHDFALVAEATVEHEIILSNFHKDRKNEPYTINLVIPIMASNATNSRCIAVLVFDIDPAKRLYPNIQSWPTSSATAETLLVIREENSVLFLNELRHRKNTDAPFFLPLSDQNLPAGRAALGEEGIFEGVDYSNIKVLSAIRTIPGTRWGLVAKIDQSEVNAPLIKIIVTVILIGVGLVFIALMALLLLTIRRRAEKLSTQMAAQKHTEVELQKAHAGLELQIAERTSDLFETNALLRGEIVEREKLEQQLLSAKRLEAIGQIAGGVAHEVRNPLNAILTITEALFREKEVASNPEFEPFILHIRTQVNRLVQLMNDLLDLGRTIPAANLQPIPLYKVCRETVDLWKSSGMSQNKRALLTSGIDDTSFLVLADGLKLQQVFFNLLENSGHHTPAGLSIIIRLMHNCTDPPDGMAVVQVIDRGTGIAEDKLVHVFDPFYTDRKGGTGLGLALVRHFIENMGGTTRIWNNDPPPGCTVEVRIPLYREEIK